MKAEKCEDRWVTIGFSIVDATKSFDKMVSIRFGERSLAKVDSRKNGSRMVSRGGRTDETEKGDTFRS